jgi:hypothetical protein
MPASTVKRPFALAASGAATFALAFGCGATSVSHRDELDGAGGGAADQCTATREGDVLVRTEAELEALRHHRLVTGDLVVDCPDCTTLEPLSCLQEVGKMLSVVGCDRIESLAGLSALRRAGLRSDNGGLAIGFHFAPWETAGNARLATLDGLGPLESVEGRIDVRGNPVLRDLSGLSGLKQVAGSIYVHDNDALLTLEDLNELVSLRGILEISDNDALVDLTGLGAFAAARGLWISDNDALATLDGLDGFWAQSLDLLLEVSGNPVLTDVRALANLQGTLRDVRFSDNDSLREVSLNSGLTILSGALVVTENAVLETLLVPGLTHVAQAVEIKTNARLATPTSVPPRTSAACS